VVGVCDRFGDSYGGMGGGGGGGFDQDSVSFDYLIIIYFILLL